MAPKNGQELEEMLEFAINLGRPVAIRYPKADDPRSSILDPRILSSIENPASRIQIGKAEILREGKDVTIIALGTMVLPSLEAANLLEKEGTFCSVINARFIKPLDTELLSKTKAKIIFTVEEGTSCGGFGSAVQEALNRPVYRIGLPDEFISHGSRDILLDKYGLTAEGIADKILKTIKLSI
jgi:1-deoxy-D-xylulose-5-phosphate synthase